MKHRNVMYDKTLIKLVRNVIMKIYEIFDNKTFHKRINIILTHDKIFVRILFQIEY